MNSKKELRNPAKEIRSKINMHDISKLIIAKLLNTSVWQNSKNIALYYPFGSEINLTPLFDENKNFYLPKIFGDTMNFCPYKTGDVLKENIYGIKEPQTEVIAPKITDLIILPALMADVNGNRLGYGKGYYDKFLTLNKIKAAKVVLIPHELLLENLPCDTWDVKSDLIITQFHVYEIINK
ncbi:MAG: 5-formyltetrahydrofolate cyclo-ligase [Candidatus Gastranaerophilales bacterium]|nr:5-formyltetrahydrofolate cyclo-ligase [Candidatus Gastranaerophilales bacterium]